MKSRTRSTAKKVISLLMILIMIISTLSDFNLTMVQAANDSLQITDCGILIDGVPYTSGMTIKETAKFTVSMQWLVQNGSTIGHIVEISLPDCINFSSLANQYAYADGVADPIGTYSVADGKLVMVIENEDIKNQSNLKGGFTLEGTLNSSVIPESGSNKISINIFDKTLILNVLRDASLNNIAVNKRTSGSYDAEKGQKFEIEIISTGKNEGIYVSDYFDTSVLELNGGVSITSTDGTAVDGTLTTSSNGFTYAFPDDFITKDGGRYTLSYYLKLKDNAYANHAGEWEKNSVNVKTKLDNTGKNAEAGFRINKTWITKDGYANSDGTASWTIVINSGDPLDIGGTVFTDSLPDDFTLISDVTITGSDGKSVTISKEDAASGISYVFPEGSGGTYTVKYTTTINTDKIDGYNPITGSNTENNKAVIKTPNHGEHTAQKGLYIKGIGSILNKTHTSFRTEDGKGIITWQSAVEVPDPADYRLTDLSYSDVVENYWGNHKLVADSIVVTHENNIVPSGNYSTVYGNSQGNDMFTLNFGDYFKNAAGGSFILITYDTVFDLPAEGTTIWPKNTGTVHNGAQSQTSSATFTYYNIPAITKGFKGTSEENTVFTWNLTINLENVSVTNPLYITEHLPENHKMEESSIKAVENIWYDPNPSIAGIEQVEYDTQKNTVTYKIDTDLVKKSYDGKQIYLIYNTRIADIKAFLQSGTQNYVNRVVIEDSGRNQIGESAATAGNVSPSADNLLNKNFTYNIYTAPYVNYTIDVNPSGLTLLDGEKQLTLTDEIGSAMVYVPGSFAVYTDSNRSNPMDPALYMVSYARGDNTLTISLPDSTPCYIAYRTKVILDYGEALNEDNAANKVKLSGELNNTASSSTSLGGVVLRSSAYVISENGSINLYKHDSMDQNKPVEGAAYTAVIKYYYENGTVKEASPEYLEQLDLYVSNGGKYDPGKQYVTDSNGNAVINNIYYDFLYEIREYSAPNGYQLNKEPVYYYIKGNLDADYSSLSEQGIDAVPVTSGTYIYVNDIPVDPNQKKIFISKRMTEGSGSSDSELPGAALKITHEETGIEEISAQWNSSGEAKEFTVTSDENADGSMLRTGIVYTLSEESAPHGYTVADSIRFMISDDGEIQLLNAAGEISADAGTLIMRDERAVYISKKADDTNSGLAGAHLQIYEAATNSLVTEWDSVATPKEFVLSANGLLTGVEYILRESAPPARYAKADDIKFIINEAGKISITDGNGDVSSDQLTLIMTDKAIGNIEITKVDSQNTSRVLQDAEFELFAADDTGFTNPIDRQTTDASGKLTFTGIPYGTYVIKEITAPAGYLIITESTEVTVNAANIQVTIANTKEPVKSGMIKLVKKDSASGRLLQGVEFTLSNLPGSDYYQVTSQTNNQGEIVFENIPYGTYKLEETAAPYGYSDIPDSIAGNGVTWNTGEKYCEVAVNDTTLTSGELTVNVTDEERKGTLTVNKTDSKTGTGLSGAQFALFDETGTTKLYPAAPADYVTTNGSGVVIFNNLSYGKYKLRELNAPAYYNIDVTDTAVTINSDSRSITVKDTQYQFYIGKTAVDGSAQIAGARMHIEPSAGNSEYASGTHLISWTTSDTAKVIKLGTDPAKDELKPGSYVLYEDSAPEGYAIGAPIAFEVAADGTITTSASNASVSIDALILTVLEEHTGKIRLVKLDAEKDVNGIHQPLAGVEFILLDSDGNKIGPDSTPGTVYTTDSNGEISISGLKYGTYILQETQTLTGYEIITEKTTVVLSSDQEDVIVYNVKTPLQEGSIRITKKDNESGAVLGGAVFELYDNDDRFIARGTSDANGIVNFSKIPYGDYILKEIEAPKNYKITNPDGLNITVDNAFITREVTNMQLKGSLTVTKTSRTGESLSGARFVLCDTAGTRVYPKEAPYYYETDEKGTLTFSDIPYGTYILREIQAPEYYVIDQAETQITINSETTSHKTITNTALTIQISKKSVTEKTELSHAVLQLLDSNGSLIKEWDTDDVPYTFRLGKETDGTRNILAPGSYVLHEKKAPDGYLKTEDISFRLNTDGSISGVPAANISADGKILTMYDAPGGNIILTKTDASNTAKFLNGAEFGLYEESDTAFSHPVDTAVTDSSGKVVFKNVGYGNYIIHEITPPAGYLIITDNIPVTVNSERTDLNHNVNVTVSNTPETKVADIKLTKADTNNTSKFLAGAKFELYDSFGNYIASAVTGSDGTVTFKNVKYGQYVIKEVSAPFGYQIDAQNEHIDVTISNQTVNSDVVSVNVTDTQLKGKILVKKEDSLSGRGLSGAEFELYDENDQLLDTQISNSDGICTFDGLVYGTYKIAETKAPENYVICTVEQTITVKEEITEIVIVNDAKSGNLKITKSDENDSSIKLPGAVYSLYDEDGNKVATGTTESDGSYVFKNITYGTYYLQEQKAPDNYEVDPNRIKVIINDDNIDPVISVTSVSVSDKKSTGVLKIVKKDVNNTAIPVAGAEFELYDKDGNKVVPDPGNADLPWITDANGEITIPDLPYGTYLLREVNAPVYYHIINQDESITINSPVTEKVIYNRNTEIQISKRMLEDTGELTGASLILRDSSGNVIRSWISGSEAQKFGIGELEGRLVPGEIYTLSEEKAPELYLLAKDITFTVDADGEITLLSGDGQSIDKTVIMYDAINPDIISRTIKISKKAVNSTEELSGALLKLTDSSGNEIISWISADTPNEITVGIDKCQILYNEIYTLTEIIAPEGYAVANSIQFKVLTDGTIVLTGNSGEVSGDGTILTMRDELLPSKDKPNDEETDDEPEEDTEDTDPVPGDGIDTGDHTPLVLLAVILLISLAVIVVLFLRNKKKDKEDEKDSDETEE